ncbi:MAG: hypothetical protein P8Y54_05240 [Xanthomonadales bacterium]
MKKIIGILLLLLLVAAGGAWYFLTFRLDGVIRQQIEQVAERSLGTEVRVGAVRTDLKNGSLTISDIEIANPAGFRNPNALTLRGIEAAVDYGTLEVRRVVIENPEMVIEEIDGDTNIDRLLRAAEQDVTSPQDDSAAPPVIVIHHFRMNSSRAALESTTLDLYTDLRVDTVELREIRGTPQEVGQQIAREILDEAAKAAAIELMKAKAAQKLDQLFNRD